MNEFLENLKREASENPQVTLAVVSSLLFGTAKLIEALGHHKGSTAYAKYARIAEKKAKKGTM